MTSIKNLIKSAKNELTSVTDTPKLEAEVLLASVLNVDRVYLITNSEQEVSENFEQDFYQLIARRKHHEPIAYILGQKEFYGLDFVVNHSVLIPRPETEFIVQRSLDILSLNTRPHRILDLGTGSGCILIAITKNLPNKDSMSLFLGVDSSENALSIAKQNAVHHGLEGYLNLRKSNWFSEVDEDNFNLIVANPPYVAKEEVLAPDLDYEPASALFSEEAGLADIKQILAKVKIFLAQDGKLILEFGYLQADDIDKFASSCGLRCKIIQDLSGKDRIAEISIK